MKIHLLLHKAVYLSPVSRDRLRERDLIQKTPTRPHFAQTAGPMVAGKDTRNKKYSLSTS